MKTQKKIQIEWLPLESLTPYENNPRKNAKAVNAVAKSIKKYGFKNPIVIDKDGVIVCGHTRYKAAEKLELEEVPCVRADDLTDEEIKQFRIVDNRTNELAEWDIPLLKMELDGLDLDDMELDWSFVGVDDVDDKKIVEDEAPEVDEESVPTCKLGDIWQLGNHRLICGDSTDEATIKNLMGGDFGKVDLLLTDPPYNVDYTGKTKDKLTIDNDHKNKSDFQEFLTKAFEVVKNNLTGGGTFYVFHASRSQREFENALNEAGLEVRQQLIWVKNRAMLGWSDYQWQHEPCFYGWKDGSHYFVDDRKLATVFEDEMPNFANMKKDEMQKLLEELYSDKISTTAIHEKSPNVSAEHPTMKPIKLLSRLIKNSSRQGDIVLDIFGGSGSTLIACEQLNRKCYMAELSPKYCDVIIKRWEKLTGKQAKKCVK